LLFPRQPFYTAYVAGLFAMGCVVYVSYYQLGVGEGTIGFWVMFAASIAAFVVVGGTVCRRLSTHLLARERQDEA
jgi:hypothetical protein